MTTPLSPTTGGWRRLLAAATAATLILAACGSDDATPLATDTDESTTTEADQPSDNPDDDELSGDPADDGTGGANPEPVVDDDEGYEPTAAMGDITDPRSHPVDDVVVSEDGTALGVRYEAAVEPCSGAVAEVIETADRVTVTLMTGLNPDAATMTCIAAVQRYELAVLLDEPLGDRELVVDEPTGDEQGLAPTPTAPPRPAPPTSRPTDDTEAANTTTTRPTTTVTDRDDDEDGPMDGHSPPGAFIGLTLDGASAKADDEGRPWRIGRVDDEIYALTADYNPNRLTFDVDDGIVTKAVLG